MAAEKVKFLEVFPRIPCQEVMFMLEAMTYKVVLALENDVKPEEVRVEAWSNQYDKDCYDGTWHATSLQYISTGTNYSNHVYGHSAIITSDSDFEFTFRVQLHHESIWLWSHGWQQNGRVHVELPRQHDAWTQGPNFDHIKGNVFLGNFIAATNAIECGFTHVLNVADNLDMIFPDNTVCYKKVAMQDGAANTIPDDKILQAVMWLKEVDKSGNKILVNCRAGIGRAGSVAVAYVYATSHNKKYSEAYKHVFSKRFVYPHNGLREALSRLF